MAKWEYCRISWMTRLVTEEEKVDLQRGNFVGEFLESEDGTKIAVSGVLKFLGSDQEPKNITKLGEELAQLGIDGWELISHTQVQLPLHEVFYLKRQLMN